MMRSQRMPDFLIKGFYGEAGKKNFMLLIEPIWQSFLLTNAPDLLQFLGLATVPQKHKLRPTGVCDAI